jgi:serine/threonine-protein kinase HipA
MSIGGVQPKVSAVLRVAAGRLELVDSGGRYILKPPHPMFPEVPENEDVTMRMAAAAGVQVPVHGLVYTEEGALIYLIERFDRVGRREKLAVEDFAQLLGLSRETKYESSMERVANVVDSFCTFPAVEKVELFRRVLVAYLTGNEDMHVKNFSIITGRDGLRKLSPAYDLVNSTIALKNAQEEMALPVMGKRSNIKRTHLVDYYGRERLALTARVIEQVLQEIAEAQETWDDLLARSFLSVEMKEKYEALLASRRPRIGL